MKRHQEKAGHRQGVQLVTLCISTSMVLVLLGLVVFSVQTSRNLSQWVKENLTVTVVLNDKVSAEDAKQFCKNLNARPFSKNIDYISREQALKEQTEAMGSDPSEFLAHSVPFQEYSSSHSHTYPVSLSGSVTVKHIPVAFSTDVHGLPEHALAPPETQRTSTA